MKKIFLISFIVLLLVAHFVFGQQDLKGYWQGALDLSFRKLRIVVWVSKDTRDSGKAITRDMDQDSRPAPGDAITLEGETVNSIINDIGADYKGEITPKGDSMF